MPNQQNEEFRLLLKSLHLEMKQLADFWGISLRSVQRWAESSQDLPNARRETLLEWQRWADEYAQQVYAWLLDGTPKPLVIYNQADFERVALRGVPDGIPTQVHQSAVARAKFLLEQKGHSVEIKRYTP
jgi:hypothetical protein